MIFNDYDPGAHDPEKASRIQVDSLMRYKRLETSPVRSFLTREAPVKRAEELASTAVRTRARTKIGIETA
ncbi:hypothetical protein GCM10008944_15800 [Cytobacillus oceanisediminis]